jgi:hypothetical protein
LHDASINGGNQINNGVKVFLGYARFQRPLDAPITSGLAATTQSDRQADEHLLAFSQS